MSSGTIDATKAGVWLSKIISALQRGGRAAFSGVVGLAGKFAAELRTRAVRIEIQRRVSKTDEFRSNNDEFCTQNDGFFRWGADGAGGSVDTWQQDSALSDDTGLHGSGAGDAGDDEQEHEHEHEHEQEELEDVGSEADSEESDGDFAAFANAFHNPVSPVMDEQVDEQVDEPSANKWLQKTRDAKAAPYGAFAYKNFKKKNPFFRVSSSVKKRFRSAKDSNIRPFLFKSSRFSSLTRQR